MKSAIMPVKFGQNDKDTPPKENKHYSIQHIYAQCKDSANHGYFKELGKSDACHSNSYSPTIHFLKKSFSNFNENLL